MELQTYYRARVVHSSLAKMFTVHIKEHWYSSWREYQSYGYADELSPHNTQNLAMAEQRSITKAMQITKTVTVFDSRKLT